MLYDVVIGLHVTPCSLTLFIHYASVHENNIVVGVELFLRSSYSAALEQILANRRRRVGVRHQHTCVLLSIQHVTVWQPRTHCSARVIPAPCLTTSDRQASTCKSTTRKTFSTLHTHCIQTHSKLTWKRKPSTLENTDYNNCVVRYRHTIYYKHIALKAVNEFVNGTGNGDDHAATWAVGTPASRWRADCAIDFFRRRQLGRRWPPKVACRRERVALGGCQWLRYHCRRELDRWHVCSAWCATRQDLHRVSAYLATCTTRRVIAIHLLLANK